MPLTEEDEDSIMLINEFKVTWYTLLSRVDAAPTIDEYILTSLNHVANLIMCRKVNSKSQNVIFEMALNLGVFENIFQWNFIFTGSDLEAFKTRELQFYDSLITYKGKNYLSFKEFVIPFMATLHHCSIRSCVAVERTLVRLLNTVCAILSSQNFDQLFSLQNDKSINNFKINDYFIPEKNNNNNNANNELFLFRCLCMGVIDFNEFGLINFDRLDPTLYHFDFERLQSNPSILSLQGMDSIDWTMCSDSIIEQDLECNNDDTVTNSKHINDNKNSGEGELSGEMGLENSPRIDSLCDLLAPYIFRDGELGWQARDSLLLIAAYSLRDEDFSFNIAKYSSICAVLATGLGMLYTALPRRLVTNNQAETWPILTRILEKNIETSKRLNEFLSALDFCCSILEIAHPLIQSYLLHCIHMVFLVSVIGPAFTQTVAEDVITATIYLEQLIIHSIGSSILPILLRFLLTKIPNSLCKELIKNHETMENYVQSNQTISTTTNTTTTTTTTSNNNNTNTNKYSNVNRNDNNQKMNSSLNSKHSHSFSENTYMDLIIARIHHCNSLLGIVTLSLVNTIIDLHCEDVMFFLILRYLVPVRDCLFKHGWTWPNVNNLTDASMKFLNLLSDQNLMNVIETDVNEIKALGIEKNKRNSIAQLNIDEVEQIDCANYKQGYKNGLEALSLKPDRSTQNFNGFPGGREFLANHVICPYLEFNQSLFMNGIMTSNSNQNDYSSYNNNLSDSDLSHTNIHNQLYYQNNYPNPYDWLSYTSWAHQSILSRKQAYHKWHLLFNANQPSLNQIYQFEYNINQFHKSFTNYSINLDNLSNLPDYEYQINLDPYQIYANYHCFLSKNNTNLDLRLKNGEKEAKAICKAIKKLDIEADLMLENNQFIDNNDNDDNNNNDNKNYTNENEIDSDPEVEADLKQINLPDQTNHCMNKNNSLSNDFHIQNSAEKHLPIIPQQQLIIDDQHKTPLENKKTFLHSTTSLHLPKTNNELIHVNDIFIDDQSIGLNAIKSKLYDQSKIKSWYCLNFLDADLLEEINTINNNRATVSSICNNNENVDESHNGISKEKVNLKSVQLLPIIIHHKIDETNEDNKSMELNRFMNQLDQMKIEQIKNSMNSESNQIESDQYFDLDRDDNIDESVKLFDDLLEQLKTVHYPIQTNIDPVVNHLNYQTNCTNKQNENLNNNLFTNVNDSINGKIIMQNNVFNESNQLMHSSLDDLIKISSNKLIHQKYNYDNHSFSQISNSTYCSPQKIIPLSLSTKRKHKFLSQSHEQHNGNNNNNNDNIYDQDQTHSLGSSSSSNYLSSLTKRSNQNTYRKSSLSSIDTNDSDKYIPISNNPKNIKLNLGPFLTTLLNRLDSFPNNSFYANLYLTNIISSLASYPIPLLRSIMFLTDPPNISINNNNNNNNSNALNETTQLCEIYSHLPYNILKSIQKQINLYISVYTEQLKSLNLNHISGLKFNNLKQEARYYLNTQADIIRTDGDHNRFCDSYLFKPNSLNLNSTNSGKSSSRRLSFLKLFRLGRQMRKSDSETRRNSSTLDSSTNYKELIDFSQILLTPMTDYTWLPDLNGIQKPIDQITNKKDNSKGRKIFSRKLFKHSSISESTDNSVVAIDWLKTQKIVLSSVIFDDFCKELAAICTEHSIQWEI